MFKSVLSALVLFCWTTAAISQSIPSYVPQNGLIGWWPFDADANDLSPNARHGQINSANGTVQFVNGKEANAIYLTGQGHVGANGDHVLIPAIGMHNFTSWTVSMWVKQDGNTGAGGGHGESLIGGRMLGDDCRGTFSLDFSGYYPNYSMGMGVHGQAGAGNVDFQANTWNCFTFVVQPNVAKGYFNGQMFNFGTGSTTTSEESVIGIGTHWFCPGTQSTRFTGAIDNVGIWNRALTEQEIQNLSNLGFSSAVTEKDMNAKLELFPNPVSDFITLKSAGQKSFSVLNAFGSEVIPFSEFRDEVKINLANLPGGMYFVRVEDPESGISGIRKIVRE